MPRSGTNLLQERLRLRYKIPNHKEPFNGETNRKTNGDPYQWVSSIDTGVVKILAQNLDYINLDRFIDTGNFDSIIVTKRSNLTDLFLSLYYAEQIVHTYHYQEVPQNLTQFIFPLIYFVDTFQIYESYLNALVNLDKNNIPYEIFDYDRYSSNDLQIVDGVEFYLPRDKNCQINFVFSGIDYSKICLNYEEVDFFIKQKIQ